MPAKHSTPAVADTASAGAAADCVRPRRLRIGSLTLDTPLLLAPMAGITDRPFRTLCRLHGAGLAVSEMLSADPSLRGTRKSMERADHSGEPGPISVQIAGADPAMMADAARWNRDRGADIIDINMGCPAKKVCKAAAGSALLRDEALVGRIVEAVVGAVDVPVTLKTRTGWSPEARNLPRIAALAEDAGIAMLVVHGRTRACRFDGEAEFDSLRELRARTDMVLVANGDIDSPQKAAAALAYTGADAVMIGRGALGRPWIFQQIAHYLATGELLPEPAAAYIRDTLVSHLDALYLLYGEARGLRVARKHIAWYSRGLVPQAGDDVRLRQALDRINHADTIRQQLTEVHALLDAQLLGEMAA